MADNSHLGKIQAFGQNYVRMMNTAKSNPVNYGIVEEMNFTSVGSNSESIILEVENTSSNTLYLVLGTPVGNPDEAPALGSFPSTIGAIANAPANAQYITDNAGVGALYVTFLNKRFERNAVYFNYLEVICDDDAQRQSQLLTITVPLNAFTDSAKRTQSFNPIYTQYNGVVLGGEKGFICGEFAGIAYPILAGKKVQMNFPIGGRTAINLAKS